MTRRPDLILEDDILHDIQSLKHSFDMASADARLQERIGVQVISDKPCAALRPDSDWKILAASTTGSHICHECE